jgi:hypothetical protein
MKFKAFNHGSNRWLEPHEYLINSDGVPVEFDMYAEVDPLLGVDVVQSTGVQDKNGKEIFEGDILQNYNGYVFEVKRQLSRESEPCWGVSDPCNYAEIIGNKFEHPELLKAATK